MVGVPRKVEGGSWDESEKVCESQQTNVDIVWNVQSLGIQLLWLPCNNPNNWIPED
jgi:hypothetical protein